MKLWFDFPSSQIVAHLGLRLDPGVNDVSEDHGKALLAMRDTGDFPIRTATDAEVAAHEAALRKAEEEAKAPKNPPPPPPAPPKEKTEKGTRKQEQG